MIYNLPSIYRSFYLFGGEIVLNRRYAPGVYPPIFQDGSPLAYVHCEEGAMSVIDDPRFADHHSSRPGNPFVISWGNSAISDLFKGNELWNKLQRLVDSGYHVEIFPATLGASWQPWDPGRRVTIDGLKISKVI